MRPERRRLREPDVHATSWGGKTVEHQIGVLVQELRIANLLTVANSGRFIGMDTQAAKDEVIRLLGLPSGDA